MEIASSHQVPTVLSGRGLVCDQQIRSGPQKVAYCNLIRFWLTNQHVGYLCNVVFSREQVTAIYVMRSKMFSTRIVQLCWRNGNGNGNGNQLELNACMLEGGGGIPPLAPYVRHCFPTVLKISLPTV